MSRWRLWVGLVASLLLGTGAALVPVLTLETDAVELVDAPGDRVRAAIDELREDRVHVPPDGRSMLDEAGEQRLESALLDADPAVYVVVWAETTDAGYDTAHDVVDQLALSVDRDGVFVVWEGPGRGRVGTLDGTAPGYLVFEGTPEARVVELLADIDGEVVEPTAREDTGDVVAGALAGAFGGAGAYGLLMTVVGVVRLGRGRGFVVPGFEESR